MPVPATAATAATTASNAASSASKLASTASVVSAAGEVAATAISAISQISDANKRRKFEQNFAQLTLEQQKGLELKVLEAKSATERLAVLSEYLTQLNSQRISNLASFYSDKEKAKRTNLLLIAGGLGVFAIIITIIILKKK